ncbi:helix-turn-helix transcriptional regulator [Halorubrum halodurans]|uniref:HTH iclR-type domain-containing protein n=1 Tax=Halorubrum halodurans TaxID=1383851 RepID=A0A256IMG4_9EURY|nr:hypothetical protein [Halorubrum halodurans]OYR57749.1 hypothetical protein DJ70_05165 [Halorubrum halodurans]
MRNPAIRVLLAAFLAVALVAGSGLVVGEPAPSSQPSPAASTPASSIGTDPAAQVSGTAVPTGETRIRIDLQPDRDARWRVVVRYEFADPNRTAAFETVGERFVDGEAGPSPGLFERFAEAASRNTDREMSVVDVEREYVVIEDPETAEDAGTGTGGADPVDSGEVAAVGELRLTFVWTEFLAEDGEDLVLGDALTTADNGTWLRSLESGQTVEVTTPEGYSISGTPGANVRLEDNAVVIEGPRVFAGDDRVAVVYGPAPATPAGETPPWTLLAGAIVLAAVVIAGGLVGYRRFGSDDPAPAGTDGSDPGHDTETRTGGESGAVGTDPNDEPDDEAGDEVEEDLSLLSDEERVERLLDRNGGRMRQADIVAETGWSDAKVSQLLSAMADEGRVEKLRLGRENLISLPDGESDGTADANGADGDDGS